ncbi:hypothetical protein GGD38_003149 [Chitinophagaceae bacterium OAS944]|nr:hypothetical protein [Chitinophagaceae bacterium OAS944]
MVSGEWVPEFFGMLNNRNGRELSAVLLFGEPLTTHHSQLTYFITTLNDSFTAVEFTYRIYTPLGK